MTTTIRLAKGDLSWSWGDCQIACFFQPAVKNPKIFTIKKQREAVNCRSHTGHKRLISDENCCQFNFNFLGKVDTNRNVGKSDLKM